MGIEVSVGRRRVGALQGDDMCYRPCMQDEVRVVGRRVGALQRNHMRYRPCMQDEHKLSLQFRKFVAQDAK
jgi:hypothetical protein